MTRPTRTRHRRPWLRVIVTEPGVAFVSGANVLELVRAAGGAPPIWSRPRHAWETSERIAGDVVALAEHYDYAITFQRLERVR